MRRTKRNYFYETLESRWPLHSQLVLSEVMYAPATPSVTELLLLPQARASQFAFVELYNPSQDDSYTLGQMNITGEIAFSFPDVVLTPGERAVIAADSAAFVVRYGTPIRILGQWQGELSTTEPQLSIIDADAHELTRFAIHQPADWPLASQGLGPSLETRDNLAIDAAAWLQPNRWNASRSIHGTPGLPPDAPSPVVINEILDGLDPQTGRSKQLELHNLSAEAVDISGWYLSDSADHLDQYRWSDGTILPAGGYLVLDATPLSPGPLPTPHAIELDAARGGELFLISAGDDGTPVSIHDAWQYAPHQGSSWGRLSPNILGTLPLETSLGRANEDLAVSPIVVSEWLQRGASPLPAALSLDPHLTAADLAFVELFNGSNEEQILANWRLAGDIEFSLPAQLSVAAGTAMLLVSFDPIADGARANAFRAHYQLSSEIRLFGPWSQNGVDADFQSIRLEEYVSIREPNAGISPWLWRDAAYLSSAAPWPDVRRSGTSLQRLDVDRPGREGSNWLGMTATPGTATFESENPFLWPDLVNWDDPLIGFNYLEQLDSHPLTGAPILRFATAMANVGQGPLVIEGREVVNGGQQVVQLVRRADGTTVELPAGEYVFHPTHHHVHFANYAEYNLRTVTPEGGVGEIVTSGEKVSFCLVDFAPYDLTLTGAPPSWVYNECERQTQGISVGWADIYGAELDDQWINIQDVLPGEYWLETVLDPLNLLRESNEENNIIRNRVVIGQSTHTADQFDATGNFDPHLGTGDQVVHHLSIDRPGDVDRFRWVSPGDGVLTVRVRLDRTTGDTDLYVWGNGTSSLIRLESSITDSDFEEVHFPVTAGSSYFVVVKDLAGFTLPDYTLTLDGPDIAPDRFEPNNTVETRKELGTGEVDLSDLNIHDAGDPDIYAWTASRSGNAIVDIRFTNLQGDLDLAILDLQGNRVIDSSTSENREAVEFVAIAGTTYLVSVEPKPWARSLNYELRVDEIESIPDAFEPNDSEQSPYDVGQGDHILNHLNIHRPFNRDVYRWRASSTGIAAVDLLFQHAAGDLDLVLWSDGEEVLFSRSQDDDEHFNFSVQQDQEFLVEVRGRNGALNADYTLSIDGPESPRITEVLVGREHDQADERQILWPGAATPLPWPDVRELEITFSKPVTVSGRQLELKQENGRTLAIEQFEYNAHGHSARWRWEESLSTGTWTLRLGTGIVDTSGNELDGESNQAGTSSGDGIPGGDFVWSFTILPGDFSADLIVNFVDLEILIQGILNGSRSMDLSGDRISDQHDIVIMVHDILHSSIGDANFDGRFDSSDLIAIFQAGEFEDLLTHNSTWSEGDWDADGDFTTSDLVFAFQMGGYAS